MADGLRKRKSTTKTETASPEKKKEGGLKQVVIDPLSGHLGVTLSNAYLDGVKIDELDAADLVFKAGLRAGDVIKALNGEKVYSHEEALRIFDNATSEVTVEYSPAAEEEEAIKTYAANWPARWKANFKFMVKLTIGLTLLSLACTTAMYHYGPPEYCKDLLDMYAFPKMGYPKPKLGVDGWPRREVIPPEDPDKPWTVPGWSLELEEAAWAKFKTLKHFSARFKDQPIEKPEDNEWTKDLFEQVRATGGKVLKRLEYMERQLEAYQMQMEGMRGGR